VRRVDVLVVGGGPAGSSLARGLVARGRSVVVLDRARFPRDKTCAGWITPPVLAALGVEPAKYATQGRTLQPIRGFRVGVCGAGDCAAAFDEVVSYGIRRCELDHFLLERSGAELALETPLERLERASDGWVVNGGLHARLLVGAGGHFCPVRRALAPLTKEPAIAAQEIEFELSAAGSVGLALDPALPELWFTPDLDGYGWVFRKGQYLNVGLGVRGGRELSSRFRALRETFAREGKLPADAPDAVHGHAYLLYGESQRPLAGERVAFIGDAAGFAYPRSGEGIRPAVESGLLLAHCIAGAEDPGDAAALASYARAAERRFGSRAPRGWIPGSWMRAAGRRLIQRPRFARDVVVKRWFLHAELPPLLP
jgi:flavin-dependent dehydrogenase